MEYSQLEATEVQIKPHEPPKIGFCSWLIYSWVYEILRQIEREKTVQVERLCSYFPVECRSTLNGQMLKDLWCNANDVSLFRALIKIYFSEFCFNGLIFSFTFLSFSGPVLLKLLVDYASESPLQWSKITLLIALLFTSKILSAFLSTYFTYLNGKLTLAMAGAIKTCVYQKVLRLSTASRVQHTAGNITNLYTVDIERVVNVFVALHNFWALPLQIFVAMWLLFDVVSFAMFGGLGAIIVIMVVNNYIAHTRKWSNAKLMVHRDARMKASSEVFGSILTIKLNGWEERFTNTILLCRTEELKYVWINMLLTSISTCLLWMAPCVVSVCTIALYASVLHKEVTAAKIFTALSLFRMLQDPLRALPGFISQTYQAQTSLERLQAFYTLSEQSHKLSLNSAGSTDNLSTQSTGEVSLKNISFAWRESLSRSRSAKCNTADKVSFSKGLFSIDSGEDDEEEEQDDSVTVSSDIDSESGGDRRQDNLSVLQRVVESGRRVFGLSSAYNKLSDLDVSEHGGPSPVIRVSSLSTFTHTTESPVVLYIDSLRVLPGQLAVVRGTIGSGKSSLCSALLNEMYITPNTESEGEPSAHSVQGSVSYVSQQAWIQNLSVRDNILFGSPYSRDKYLRVLDACCLVQDLQEFPQGDRTEIGEKGINLSGGQKARIALARAVYADADIIILDDILAALDSIVARKVFERCVLGLLCGKTRILSTHNEEVLSHYAVNLTVSLESGTASEVRDCSTGWRGRPIVSICDVEYRFADDVGAWQCTESDELTSSGDESQSQSSAAMAVDNVAPNSVSSKHEVKGTGNFKSSVYLGYFRAMGGLHILVILACIQTVWQCLLVGSDLYLTFWTRQSDEQQRHNLSTNLAIYSSLALGSGVLVFARTFTVSYTGYRAAKVMHEGMLHSLIYAPMAWHDNNPSGRILNRLSDDQSKIDDNMCFVVGSVFATGFSMLGMFVAILAITRYLIVAIIPLTVIYVHLLMQYIKAGRELQRMISVTQSPVLTFMSESVVGVTIIRAFGSLTLSRFITKNESLIDTNATVNYIANCAQAWVNLRVQLLSAFVLLGAAVLSFASLNTFMTPGLVGMTIAIGLELSGSLQNAIYNFSNFETSFVCPERVQQYMEIEAEGTEEQKMAYRKFGDGIIEGEEESIMVSSNDNDIEMQRVAKPTTTTTTLPSDWPAHGSIEFNNVSFKYQLTSPLVLSDLSFAIRSGEKIGIVGRTGSGKSSLSMCLFRIAELAQGSVCIDEVDVSTLPLSVLRSAMQIIPQSPVLFKGSVRAYLDPLSQFSDEAVWTAIDKSQIRDTVMNLGRHRQSVAASLLIESSPTGVNGRWSPLHNNEFAGTESAASQGLDSEIEENGGNLSVGERQMLVLAKALLCKTRILLLDEATASVDMETDRRVQRILREEFKDSTVLTIAHRIETIMHYDRVMVLSAGRIVEFDAPEALMRNEDSLFSRLARDANIGGGEEL